MERWRGRMNGEEGGSGMTRGKGGGCGEVVVGERSGEGAEKDRRKGKDEKCGEVVVGEMSEGRREMFEVVDEQRVKDHGPLLVLRYKKVANQTKPVSTTLPEEYRIVRRAHPNPLDTLPKLPIRPPTFVPGNRYTQERHDELVVDADAFLWPEELKLVHQLILLHEDGFTWEESEKGALKEEYFDQVVIPTIEHTPWNEKSIPVPPGIRDEVLKYIKEKIATGVYEPSNSSYRSSWFCVPKKNGKIRIVHNLQPLNRITIRDAAVPPFTEHMAESYGGRACYGMPDLFVAFDQRKLDVRSRDLTTFVNPLGTFRLTTIPMGWTNSFQIMHGDVTFALRDEIPDFTTPYADDVAVKGPLSRYETENGSYEVMAGNSGIRRFVWEHLQVMNRVIQRIKAVGGTFSGKKLQICGPTAEIVGHRCTYEGRIPDDSKVQRIRDWPACRSLTEVRAFLGTLGIVRIFVKNFSMIARPLIHLTRKGVKFRFGEEEQRAMDKLKTSLLESPALRPIDYMSDREVIMAVDSSNIGTGYVLYQVGEDGRRYPNRFGSITWNEREKNYSQAKVELYGLMRSLRAARIFIIGLKRLTVEVDAKYIKGMINNPDIQPNATINRWIAAILLFDFKLVHVPGTKHTGADGLSRRPAANGDEAEKDDFEDWIDRANAFSLGQWEEESSHLNGMIFGQTLALGESLESEGEIEVPRSENAQFRDKRLDKVLEYLESMVRPSELTDLQFKQFLKLVSRFFAKRGELWKRRVGGQHQKVVKVERRGRLMKEAHDELGHKGVFSVRARLADRFWWPKMDEDIKWYVRTCHVCQTRQTTKIRIPPTVPSPATLFRKVYIDTMFMPKAGGYTYIVQARCSLTSYPEFRMLRSETAKTLGDFIFEDILCRWGALYEIVSDNGTAFKAALKTLAETYGIHHIRISAYNSRANGPVERRHRDVREAIMKAANGIIAHWPQVVPAVFWAERVTIQKSTGFSPYYMVHGVEPVLPFDLAEATYLVPDIGEVVSTSELLANRARQLLKRESDLAVIGERVIASRNQSRKQFEEQYRNTIVDFDFSPGDLVLVRNTRVELEANRKAKPRYLGPLAVVRRTAGGSYELTELNGAVSLHRYAAFRLVPYFPRSKLAVPVTSIIEEEAEQER